MDETKVLSISELQKSLSEATQTDEPVAIDTPTGNVVNGDSTKFATNEPASYTLTFWLPVSNGVPEGAKLVMGGTAYEQKVEAKAKFITARIARKVRSYASTITLAFTDFKDNGDSALYTPEELLKIYSLFDDEVVSACEKLLESVLGVDHSLMEYITDMSLVENCSKVIQNNPSFFQDGELPN